MNRLFTLPSHWKPAAITLLVGVTTWLAGCAASAPPAQWLRLPADAGTSPMPPPDPSTAAQVWQLVGAVALPGHLDRDAVLVPSGNVGNAGNAGLQPLPGVRWAEPLRDAVPRLLRGDLARALGSPLWLAPLPPGVRPTRQLRVELLALDVGSDGRSVVLQARWSVADASGASAPRLGEAALQVPAGGSDGAALAAAHRQALQQLAQRIAAAAALR